MKRFIFTLLFAVCLRAQTPMITNARTETRAVSGDPVRFLQSLAAAETGPLWFGYAVESEQKRDNSCCWTNNNCGCRLEGGQGGVTINGQTNPVKLEGSRTLIILYRVEKRKIGKVQMVSENCPLDGGGLPFVWVTGVTANASLALLSAQVGTERDHESDSALVAIAMHAGSGADEALERFTAVKQPEWLREKALFWLASARGSRGLTAVRQAASHDPSDHIREKAMFDFSISHDPSAVDDLIHYARRDNNPKVREQALFWLAQKAGKKSAETITDSINNDPDTEVKKKAVFALNNLPKDEGVPLLIRVAKTNRNPEVRKQAMFWLGQSGDARALAFITEVLER